MKFLIEKSFLTIILLYRWNQSWFNLEMTLILTQKLKTIKSSLGQLMGNSGYCKAFIRVTYWVI